MGHNRITVAETAALRFLLSIPEGTSSDAAKKLPVLCFLHGLGEGPPLDIRTAITAHGPLRPGSSRLATDRFLVVGPQLPLRGDIWHEYADAVAEIVVLVQREHGGDPDRTYLTGFSYGGNGVFDLALDHPSLFAALWAVDPTRVPAANPGLPVWLSSGEVSRHYAAGFIQRLQLQPAAGHSGERVYTDEGLDHVGTASSAYRDDRIYRWLLARHG